MTPVATTMSQLDTVQSLVECNLDAAAGLEQFGADHRDDRLRRRLLDLAEIRRRHAEELQREIAESGARAEQSGSWRAGVCRLWLHLRGMFHPDPDDLWLRRCVRADREMLAIYTEAIARVAEDHAATLQVLRRQQAHVQHTIDVLDDLRRLRQAG